MYKFEYLSLIEQNIINKKNKEDCSSVNITVILLKTYCKLIFMRVNKIISVFIPNENLCVYFMSKFDKKAKE